MKLLTGYTSNSICLCSQCDHATRCVCVCVLVVMPAVCVFTMWSRHQLCVCVCVFTMWSCQQCVCVYNVVMPAGTCVCVRVCVHNVFTNAIIIIIIIIIKHRNCMCVRVCVALL